jgi:hypothetical protein
MEQFSLEEYFKNPTRPIVTRDGRSARIICTDAKRDFPLIALIEKDDYALLSKALKDWDEESKEIYDRTEQLIMMK